MSLEYLEGSGLLSSEPTAREEGLVACRRCTKVWPLGTHRCGRCDALLESRDTKSLQKVWAWWIVGVACYFPAQLLPMLETRTFFSTLDSTIVLGAIELAQHGDWAVAGIILTASVGIPLAKFIAIAYLATSIHRKDPQTPDRRYGLYAFVEYIGRWSMIDVFVVAILTSLVQLNILVSIKPGPAAIAFALSVIFTMLSAQSFDSRLIWDRDKPGGRSERNTVG